jgi:hypothetical protein
MTYLPESDASCLVVHHSKILPHHRWLSRHNWAQQTLGTHRGQNSHKLPIKKEEINHFAAGSFTFDSYAHTIHIYFLNKVWKSARACACLRRMFYKKFYFFSRTFDRCTYLFWGKSWKKVGKSTCARLCAFICAHHSRHALPCAHHSRPAKARVRTIQCDPSISIPGV